MSSKKELMHVVEVEGGYIFPCFPNQSTNIEVAYSKQTLCGEFGYTGDLSQPVSCSEDLIKDIEELKVRNVNICDKCYNRITEYMKIKAIQAIKESLKFKVTRSNDERLYQFYFNINNRKIHIQKVIRSDIKANIEHAHTVFKPFPLCDTNQERREICSEIMDESSLRLAVEKLIKLSNQICVKCADEVLNKEKSKTL